MRRLVALLAFALVIPTCAQAPPARAYGERQKIDAGNGDTDWPTYGGDAGGQRYSPHQQIDRSNVSSLQPAWVFHTHVFDKPSPASNLRANFEATPVLWHGMLFFDTPFDQLMAVDAETGKQVWSFDPEVNREGGIYIVASRGVSLWHGSGPAEVCGRDRVLVATLDRRLIARDALTGRSCEHFGMHGTVDLAAGLGLNDFQQHNYSFTSPPTIIGDVVIVGSSISDNQAVSVASGCVRGYDVRTGRQLWSWDPMPWAGGNTPKTGGGNAWSILSADPEHDLVFVPTGSPAVDFYGGLRPGDNRDADSLVALQASTGKKVWAFQLVHHDLWDYDTPSEPMLFTFRNKVPAVAITAKTGMVFVFNRLTGEPLYPIVERPVPQSDLPGEKGWPTQPFSTLPSMMPLSFGPQEIHMRNPADQASCRRQLGALINKGIFTPPALEPTLFYPGSLGGANWGSPGLDPTTGVLYVHINSLAYSLQQNTRATAWRRKALRYLSRKALPATRRLETPDGGEITEQVGTPYELYRKPITTADGVPCAPQPFGGLTAINLNTGMKLWTVPQGTVIPGEQTGVLGVRGPVVTAGGLVFIGATLEPTLRAYDSTSGKVLWEGKLPGAANATPMSYMLHGRQYVVVAAGGSGMLGAKQADTLIAFALPVAAKRATKQNATAPLR